MEDWDQETVNKVVESKKTEHNQNKPTDIEKKEDKTSTPTQTMVVMTWILYATYRSDFECGDIKKQLRTLPKEWELEWPKLFARRFVTHDNIKLARARWGCILIGFLSVDGLKVVIQ
ncbi:Zinc finger CCCH domain-containing protein 21 [Glycine max]|nr:Zinc finger CCCH domain-containing protein 21 [Glycine max]